MRGPLYAVWVFSLITLVIANCSDSTSSSSSNVPDLVLSTGQAASVVIGQADFTSKNAATPTSQGLNRPYGSVLVSNGALFIADTDNNRVLMYNSLPSTNYAAANLVFGFADFISSTAASPPTASSLSSVQGATSYGGKLAFADAVNNRVLIFNSVPSSNEPSASVVVGQTGMTTSTTGCTASTLNAPQSSFLAAGKLLIADSGRVLIYNSIPTSHGASADLVLGQSLFTSCALNRGGAAGANTLGAVYDVWTDGTRVVVADNSNSRVLVWNTFPTTNGQSADFVLGQANFTDTSANGGGSVSATVMREPVALTSNTKQLVVADSQNNRVLIWNSFPTTSTTPDVVLGQTDFVSSSFGLTSTTLRIPAGVHIYETKLLVSDWVNNRVLIYQGE